MYDFTYMGYIQQSNSWRQKEEWWLPEFVFNKDGISVWEDKNVPEPDCDGGGTTMRATQ